MKTLQGREQCAPELFQLNITNLDIDSGAWDRKDKQLNEVCVLQSSQTPVLSNWNKRNKKIGLGIRTIKAEESGESNRHRKAWSE